jgi:hypothetical protein
MNLQMQAIEIVYIEQRVADLEAPLAWKEIRYTHDPVNECNGDFATVVTFSSGAVLHRGTLRTGGF